MTKISFSSLCAHELPDNRSTKPHVLPIYASSSFEFENLQEGIDIFTGKTQGHVYSRYGNPTIDTVAKKMGALEGFGLEGEVHAFLCSTGMAAIHTALLAVAKKGNKILTQGNLYGGTTELFNKVFTHLGIEPVFTNLQSVDAIQEALKEHPDIKLLYCETPANPTLACIDLEAIGKLCKEHGLVSIIDNTFATPYLQQPLKYGIDIIIHSTTKYLNGHGNSIAGAIICKNEALSKDIWNVLKLTGGTCNAFDAWLLHNGVKTLPLRMDKHCSNALYIAQRLEAHRKVIKVNYPGLKSHESYAIASRQMSQYGGMMSFEVDGGLEAGKTVMNNLQFCTLAPTLGDIDTLILHPASMSHLKVPKELRERNGITDGLIRLSVGIEDAEDILADIENALEKV